MEIIKQRDGHVAYNGERIYLDDPKLAEILPPGSRFSTDIQPDINKIIFTADKNGANKVSSKVKKGKVISVLDKVGQDRKTGKSIKEALEDCTFIKITFYKDEEGKNMVVIQGTVDTAKVLLKQVCNDRKRPYGNLTSITFCAGSGISSDSLMRSGFEEKAFVEWAPSEKSRDKFANIYAKNHPDVVMFNVPMEELDANDLPNVDLWFASLDCTDFTKLASSKSEEQLHTMHLFMILMKLFYQRPKNKRPSTILIENVPQFAKVAGNSLRLALEKEGFHVTMQKMDGIEHGSRTKRDRFFFAASIFEGFAFPVPTGALTTPIADDGVITPDKLVWLTKDDSDTLKHFIERNNSISHGHKIIAYDVTKQTYIGTIPKSHHKLLPENLIKHPTKPNTYAFLKDISQLKYLHGIREDYYLGDSRTTAIQCIGQGVDCTLFDKIAVKLHDFLYEKIFAEAEAKVEAVVEKVKDTREKLDLKLIGNQFCFNF